MEMKGSTNNSLMNIRNHIHVEVGNGDGRGDHPRRFRDGTEVPLT